jgi:DNA-binding MarR family transcriptional regulator
MELSQRDEATRAAECLRHLVQRLRASAHEAQQELGLSGAQAFVLRELAREPGCSIRRLSELTLTDPSSVSVVVAKLGLQGLVASERDVQDSRRRVLRLTPRGQRLLARAPEPYQVRLIRGLRALGARQLVQLRRALTRLLDEPGVLQTPAPLFFENEGQVEQLGRRRKPSARPMPASDRQRRSGRKARVA